MSRDALRAGAAAAVVFSLTISLAVAQTSRPAEETFSEPRWVRVTGDAVYIRSRADLNSIPVAKADRNVVLRAFGRQYDWYEVEPPAGVFSYVHGDFIEMGEGRRGRVRTESGALRVRVGSTLRKVDPFRTEVQARLNKGEEVEIVGREGAWLRIVPPEAVRVYVSADYAEPVSADVARRLKARQRPVATQPAVAQKHAKRGGAQAVGQPIRRAAATQPVTADTGVWGQRLQMLETVIRAEAAKPLGKREWATLIARLRPIADQREAPVAAKLAARWVVELEKRIAREDAYRAAQAVLQEESTARQRLRGELKKIESAAKPKSIFAARGVLRISRALKVGRKGLRYHLEDPLDQTVIGYLEIPTDSAARPAEAVGGYVGVIGRIRPEQTLGAPVIEVQRIIALEDDSGQDVRDASSPRE